MDVPLYLYHSPLVSDFALLPSPPVNVTYPSSYSLFDSSPVAFVGKDQDEAEGGIELHAYYSVGLEDIQTTNVPLEELNQRGGDYASLGSVGWILSDPVTDLNTRYSPLSLTYSDSRHDVVTGPMNYADYNAYLNDDQGVRSEARSESWTEGCPVPRLSGGLGGGLQRSDSSIYHQRSSTYQPIGSCRFAPPASAITNNASSPCCFAPCRHSLLAAFRSHSAILGWAKAGSCDDCELSLSETFPSAGGADCPVECSDGESSFNAIYRVGKDDTMSSSEGGQNFLASMKLAGSVVKGMDESADPEEGEKVHVSFGYYCCQTKEEKEVRLRGSSSSSSSSIPHSAITNSPSYTCTLVLRRSSSMCLVPQIGNPRRSPLIGEAERGAKRQLVLCSNTSLPRFAPLPAPRRVKTRIDNYNSDGTINHYSICAFLDEDSNERMMAWISQIEDEISSRGVEVNKSRKEQVRQGEERRKAGRRAGAKRRQVHCSNTFLSLSLRSLIAGTLSLNTCCGRWGELSCC